MTVLLESKLKTEQLARCLIKRTNAVRGRVTMSVIARLSHRKLEDRSSFWVPFH